MTEPLQETLARLDELHGKATRPPWCFYHPSEFPRDWRIARADKAGALGPGSRDYIGRFTQSHDRARSGNGGRALEGPLEADVRLMVELVNAYPALRAEIERLRSYTVHKATCAVSVGPEGQTATCTCGLETKP